ncbi:hypothetical protein ACQQ2N_19290 [Dokdonella sp. MW10]|uniref:hypothetical protein n=1 Tax=Dokdonella sp. MW10 TaxID=2992926 RepID=UPI003F7FF3D5
MNALHIAMSIGSVLLAGFAALIAAMNIGCVILWWRHRSAGVTQNVSTLPLLPSIIIWVAAVLHSSLPVDARILPAWVFWTIAASDLTLVVLGGVFRLLRRTQERGDSPP